MLLLLGNLQRFINVSDERIGGLICGFPHLRQVFWAGYFLDIRFCALSLVFRGISPIHKLHQARLIVGCWQRLFDCFSLGLGFFSALDKVFYKLWILSFSCSDRFIGCFDRAVSESCDGFFHILIVVFVFGTGRTVIVTGGRISLVLFGDFGGLFNSHGRGLGFFSGGDGHARNGQRGGNSQHSETGYTFH